MIDTVLDRDAVVESIEHHLEEKKPYLPYITISREPGSGGRPIARLVAKQLGYKLYDTRLLKKVAEKLHTSERILVDIDEKQRSVIMDLVQNLFNPDYVSDELYFRNLCQVVLSITQTGGAIIVGRGANFIAPKAYGLQVQIVAPYKVRVARTVQYEQITYSKAREAIRHLSDERAAFVKQYFGKDVSGTKYYDMTLNTTFYSIEAAARLIIDAYKAKFPKGKIVSNLY